MAGSAAKLPASATATRSSMISNAVSPKGQELRPSLYGEPAPRLHACIAVYACPDYHAPAKHGACMARAHIIVGIMHASLDFNASPKSRSLSPRVDVRRIEKRNTGIRRSHNQREAFTTRATRRQGAHARAAQRGQIGSHRLNRRNDGTRKRGSARTVSSSAAHSFGRPWRFSRTGTTSERRRSCILSI